jgi:hypothetical protein
MREGGTEIEYRILSGRDNFSTIIDYWNDKNRIRKH